MENFPPSMPRTDRISALPDSIICHILSFLPTQEAVATSILSKRWIPLWKAIPSLNFDDVSYLQNSDFEKFIELVYTSFLLRDMEQTVKKFNLVCMSASCHSSMVNTLVMFANQRKVEHISLSLPSTISLPCNVFSSTTLVVLKLSGFSLNLNKNSSIHFPSLKVLDLRKIHFPKRQYVVEFLSACPILDVLVIKSLTCTDPLIFGKEKHYELSKLVKVDVFESSIVFPLKLFTSVEFLRANVATKQDLSILNFWNLTYLELRIFCFDPWNWVVLLLPNCPRLQNLVIDKRHQASVEKWVHPQFVPECLISKLKRFCVTNYSGMECELQFSRLIMENARVLRKITICSKKSSYPEEKLQMLKDLSLYLPRVVSQTCEFHFE